MLMAEERRFSRGERVTNSANESDHRDGFPPDRELVQRVLKGDDDAFEIMVRKYQNLVCSIAFAVVGDVAASEDVGQEAFVAAWNSLSKLEQPEAFKTWICSITRNLAIKSIRKQRPSLASEFSDVDGTSPDESPESAMIDREESELVWDVLSKLPMQYREPLILYYRQENSVADVANALDLTEATAKKRLSRGREMLRQEVTEAIEKSLRRSVPTAAFTVAVVTMLPSKTAAAATLAAGASAGGTAATAGKILTPAAAGLSGALLGTIGGLLGGLLGARQSYRYAKYQRQRKLVVQSSVVYVIGLVIFALPFFLIEPLMEMFGHTVYWTWYGIWMGVFFLANGLWMRWVFAADRRIDEEESAAGTETLPNFNKMQERQRASAGSYTSRRHWRGLPVFQLAGSAEGDEPSQVARAWIAVGHRANGRILAIGVRAVAPISIGVMSTGLVSCGVVSFGVFSTGVLAIGLAGVGVCGIGVFSVGSIAAGVWASGSIALGVIAANGPLAVAGYYSVGAVAVGPQANTEVAIEYMKTSPAMQSLESAQAGLLFCCQPTVMYPFIAIMLAIGWFSARKLQLLIRENAESAD